MQAQTAQVSCMDRWAISQRYSTLHLCLSTWSTQDPTRVSLWQDDREERKKINFSSWVDWLGMSVHNKQKWLTAYIVQSGVSLKTAGWRNVWMGRALRRVPGHLLCMETEVTQDKNTRGLFCSGKWFGYFVQGLKEWIIKGLESETPSWGPTGGSGSVMTFVLHINAHRETSTMDGW